jgi:hypothetical protein
MLRLANSALTVDLLDPADPTEQARQGPRYCWGGYIWQVSDARLGPLLAGPQWPQPDPTPHNGKGLPESFRHSDFHTQRPLRLRDDRGWVVGIGEVVRSADAKFTVTKPCTWHITPAGDALEFCTAQSGDGYGTQLTRHIALDGRTLTSSTQLTNTGERPLPLHWFAHPFFALNDRLITCDLPAGTTFAENPGYALDTASRLTFKRRFESERDGHFEQLRLPRGQPLRARVSHPLLTEIVFTTDFPPDLCPVWGNSNTWSIEPYLITELAPGATRTWSLRYEFGLPKN